MLGLSEGRILTQGEKSEREYGLRAVRNMWSTYTSGPLGIGYNSVDYVKNMDLAMGRPTDFRNNVGRFLGNRDNEMLREYGINSIDPQLVNLCPKFVNYVHGKLMDFKYEIGVDVIDAASMDEKKELEKDLRAYVKLKDFMEGIGAQFMDIKGRSGMDDMPETMEDVELLMGTTYKHAEAMRAELELVKVHNVNDWEAIKSKFVWELIVQGVAGVRTFVDEYAVLREEWFPINRFVCSYSESEDFDKMTHAGIIDYLTPDQFWCEAKDTMPENEMLEIIKKYATTNYGASAENPGTIGYDNQGNVKYIRVMRFQFLEEDIENYVERTDPNGNVYQEKKKANFVIAKEEMKYYESGEKKHIRLSIKSKYGGVWVVGSDKVYDYGLIQQGNDARLDYHVYAPNMRNGRVVSMVAQIREPLEMLSVAWTRYKDVLGKGYNGTLEINLDLLADLTLGKAGSNPNWKHALDLFTVNNIVLAKGKRNAHDQNVGRAIEILNQGLGAADFQNAITMCIEMIRSICGINELSDGSTPKAGTLNGVMEMANAATNTNLSHYYRAYNSIYRRASLALLGYWKSIPSNEAWEREYVIGVDAATTPEEWAAFYAGMEKQTMVPLIDGGLKYSDTVELRNVKNLKQAELMAKNRCRRNMKEARAIQAEQMAQQQEQSMAAAKMASEAKKEQMALDVETFIRKEGFLTGEIIKRKQPDNEAILMGKQIDSEARDSVARTNMRASVTKEAQRASSDQTVQAMKNEMEQFWSMMEARMHEMEMALKSKEIDHKKEEKAEKKEAAA
jgi:hypothetical protein